MKKVLNINFLFFLSLFFIFLLPPTDPDLGWHLRCGQEFWQNHTFCNLNQFSVLLPNYSWPNHYWLYQTIIFPVFKFFGLWGLTVFNALLMSLAFFFFFLSVKNFLFEKLLGIGLTLFLAWGVFSFGLRSQEMGFFFFSLLLLILSRIRQRHDQRSLLPTIVGIRLIWLMIPLIFLLWANTHGGSVILGIILLVFFVSQTKQIWQIGLISLISFLTTLVNPFGIAIYQDAFRHFGAAHLDQLIAEWVPPPPFIWWLILLSAAILSFVLFSAIKAENFVLGILILAFGFWALKARRNLPFYLVLWFDLFFVLPILKKSLGGWLSKDSLRNYLAFLTVLLFLFFGFLHLPQTLTTNLNFQNYCNQSSVIYPCKAIEFLKNLPAGRQDNNNLFNRYEWGGFLIWQLPEMKIFVDGRMPAWLARRSLGEGGSVSPYTIYLETLQNQPGWQKTLADYKIGWIMIVPNTFMDLLLREDPVKFGWSEVYRDQIAVIYKRL